MIPNGHLTGGGGRGTGAVGDPKRKFGKTASTRGGGGPRRRFSNVWEFSENPGDLVNVIIIIKSPALNQWISG